MTGRHMQRRLNAALLFAARPIARATDSITLYTEEYPPFNWADKKTGAATGLSTDIILDDAAGRQ